MFDSTVVLYLLHMAHPHAECTHTHSHGAVQGIMRMRTPSIRCKVVLTGEQNTHSVFFLRQHSKRTVVVSTCYSWNGHYQAHSQMDILWSGYVDNLETSDDKKRLDTHKQSCFITCSNIHIVTIACMSYIEILVFYTVFLSSDAAIFCCLFCADAIRGWRLISLAFNFLGKLSTTTG